MSVSLSRPDTFVERHIGPDMHDTAAMLRDVEAPSLDAFIASVIPAALRTPRPLQLPAPLTEAELLAALRTLAAQNKIYRSFIGMGYYDTITPPVILRNVLENPGWYTQYTPYQAEIAQGRLEALLNFQTMVIDLTGLEIANASLLDEGTAAAEAMTMFHGQRKNAQSHTFFVAETCHPQTLAVLQTRAKPLGIQIEIGDHRKLQFTEKFFGAIVQYPASDGVIHDYREFCERAHAAGAHVVVATDLMSLALLTPPGEFGADAAIGSSQRFGVPLG
ncbi:glycine dehydrogenase (aminomethyl-transferring), partial [candidate division KSB1 bacterium]|nr:glycine dehydrogenase (aminomethyl-transferring) [candidate division KSB1 bacterium]